MENFKTNKKYRGVNFDQIVAGFPSHIFKKTNKGTHTRTSVAIVEGIPGGLFKGISGKKT